MCDFHLHASLLVGSMKRNRIKLLCLDLDSTLLDVHTKGKWADSAERLAAHARPIFLEIVPTAVRKGIVVCVVTFSPQRTLIQRLLEIAFGQTVARQILIRAADGSWNYKSATEVPTTWRNFPLQGKLGHIKSVAIKIFTSSTTVIAPSEVVLIEDTPLHVAQATQEGIRAFLLDAKDPNAGDSSDQNPLFMDLMDAFRAKDRGPNQGSNREREASRQGSRGPGGSQIVEKGSRFRHETFPEVELSELCITFEGAVEGVETRSTSTTSSGAGSASSTSPTSAVPETHQGARPADCSVRRFPVQRRDKLFEDEDIFEHNSKRCVPGCSIM